MADKELRRLSRRELLQMLIVQCEETERLQQEADAANARLREIEESYERLKAKLNVKDERLNQKDATIAELNATIEEMQSFKLIELNETGSIAEAALRLNGIFEIAQKSAEQYLMNVKRLCNEATVDAMGEEVTVDDMAAGIQEKWAAQSARITQAQQAAQVRRPEILDVSQAYARRKGTSQSVEKSEVTQQLFGQHTGANAGAREGHYMSQHTGQKSDPEMEADVEPIPLASVGGLHG